MDGETEAGVVSDSSDREWRSHFTVFSLSSGGSFTVSHTPSFSLVGRGVETLSYAG